ncbi:TIGR02281 family clan AA aspartic protease [Aliikangiella marina]|uniref:TIGR02281 family clan AA aspartic protease n=1 Tax=Aliikangiella marina TaxID=1712262 RepID=A0A545TA52_9GAMM|nr:TIGR02281 family clan AA aspartic protease [Aliikangiella marina]TQV74091.1 TIGR02281 family clan AA aspartic protease [Aliikangiella marina]
MRQLAFLIIFFTLIGVSLRTIATENLKVIGLFKNAAMVDYNGKQKLYRAGQNIDKNIKLIKADTKVAVFEINGKSVEMGLQATQSFNANYSQPAQETPSANKVAKILRGNNGMYHTPGFINGVAVNFLVDTGASQVAMSEQVAKRIGLLYELNGQRVGVNTAAGMATAWALKLNKVKVGGIELINVDALVIKGAGPTDVLLGMSFLNRVKMIDNGQILQLTKKF